MAAAPKTVKDVPSHEFVVAYAQYLRSTGKFETPTWVDLVKTSVGKEMAPYDPDWYYIRAGNILQQLEQLKIVEKSAKGGRCITADGQRDLDRIAGRIASAEAA
eukprot:gene25903-31704_t